MFYLHLPVRSNPNVGIYTIHMDIYGWYGAVMTSAEGGFGCCMHCNKKLYKQYSSIAAYIFYFMWLWFTFWGFANRSQNCVIFGVDPNWEPRILQQNGLKKLLKNYM